MSVSLDKRPEGYAILKIHKEPVNAFDLDLWRELEERVEDLEEDKE